MSTLLHEVSKYVLLPKNTLCYENEGMAPIDDLDTCKTAKGEFGITRDVTSYTTWGYPKGCYKSVHGDAYFNRHSTGSKALYSAPICKYLC